MRIPGYLLLAPVQFKRESDDSFKFEVISVSAYPNFEVPVYAISRWFYGIPGGEYVSGSSLYKNGALILSQGGDLLAPSGSDGYSIRGREIQASTPRADVVDRSKASRTPITSGVPASMAQHLQDFRNTRVLERIYDWTKRA